MTIEEAIIHLEMMAVNRRWVNGEDDKHLSHETQSLYIAIKILKEQTERPDYRKP